MLLTTSQKMLPSWRMPSRVVVSTNERTPRRKLCSLGTTSLTPTAARLVDDPTLIPQMENRTATEYFDIRNPADPDSVVATGIPVMDQNEAKMAIDRSKNILKSWRDDTTGAYRGSLLEKWSSLMTENSQDLATIMTLEAGKPIAESLAEVKYASSYLHYYAGEAVRPNSANGGTVIPTPFVNPGTTTPRGQILTINQAIGVTALITPWNFPSAMITRKIGPALAAGCTSVIKPSSLTPLSAIALKTLAIRAGIPSEVIELVTASTKTTSEIGNEFSTNPVVQKLSFTGSTRVGKILMKQSSDTVKKLSLELGGNAPFVVFEDIVNKTMSDGKTSMMDQAVQAAIAAKFRNAGQTCVCADRFLIHSSLQDEFVSKLSERIEKEFVVGSGMDKATTMGPLISTASVHQVHDKVTEAIEQDGATCVLGGNPMTSVGPQFYEPTILTNVSPSSKIWKEETFGPVVAIIPFDTEEEALHLANDSNVGLASYFMTSDLSRGFRFAKKLETGIVGVNDGIISTCTAPFGGIKESGLGREGGPTGIADYLETKYIFFNG